MSRTLPILLLLICAPAARAGDEPDPKPAKLRWAERVAADFLNAGTQPQAVGAFRASAAALLSADYRKLIEAENDTPATFVGTRFGTLLGHPESWKITARELSPDADEAVFEGVGLDKDSRKTGSFVLRVSKEESGGKWRVGYFGIGESKLAAGSSATTTSAMLAEEKSRPATADAHVWDSKSVELGDTGFVAAVGPWGTENPIHSIHYSVAVHERLPDGTESVCFDAKIQVAGLPKGFTDKPIKEIVRFDPALRLVTFDLGGGQEARYKLPPNKKRGGRDNRGGSAMAATEAPPDAPPVGKEPEFKSFNRLPDGWNLVQTKAFLSAEWFAFDEEPKSGNGHLRASKYIGPEDTYRCVRIEFEGGYSVHVLELATDS